MKRSLATSLLLLSLCAPALSANSLAVKSPFLPPGHGVTNEPVQVKPVIPAQGPLSREIEFRGVIEIGGVYQFSIFNKKEQKGYWLRQSTSENGITVQSYDAGSSSVVVNMNGRSERITLMAATDSPLPVAQVDPGSQPKSPISLPQPNRPPQLNNPTASSSNDSGRRVIPRRRVILPQTEN
jgi:hypothetical protein